MAQATMERAIRIVHACRTDEHDEADLTHRRGGTCVKIFTFASEPRDVRNAMRRAETRAQGLMERQDRCQDCGEPWPTFEAEVVAR